jgi:membrane-bound serine protease (ClpP class)
MRHKIGLRIWIWLVLVGMILPAQLFLAVRMVWAQSQGPVAVVLTANGPLTPAMFEYLKRGLQIAARDNAELVVLQLNTPGGSIDLLNKMVESIRASAIPVVVYVTPRGAMAASAGTVLTMAGHAAAMAPETAIGAASPVGAQGEDIATTEATKVKEMLKATVRTLATQRSAKAISLAESTIDHAVAVSNVEAKQAGLVDFIATDVNDLLRQLNGYQVQTITGTVTLNTQNITVVPVDSSLIEQLLTLLTDPNIVFILLAVGAQALLIELSNPGGWIAGFVGVVCLALAVYGLGILPVNWFGIVFLVIAFVLFILDIKAPTHGALTAAGVVSFIIGALVLFNSPGVPSFQRVSVPLVVGTALVIAAFFFTILTIALRAQRVPVRTGVEALGQMTGRLGLAHSELNPKGTVQVGNELWSAELVEDEKPLPRGSQVMVVARDRNHIKVKAA